MTAAVIGIIVAVVGMVAAFLAGGRREQSKQSMAESELAAARAREAAKTETEVQHEIDQINSGDGDSVVTDTLDLLDSALRDADES
jgi:H+/gluconate symporter-like permease